MKEGQHMEGGDEGDDAMFTPEDRELLRTTSEGVARLSTQLNEVVIPRLEDLEEQNEDQAEAIEQLETKRERDEAEAALKSTYIKLIASSGAVAAVVAALIQYFIPSP